MILYMPSTLLSDVERPRKVVLSGADVPASNAHSAAESLTPGRVSGGRAMLGHVTGERAMPLAEEHRTESGRDEVARFRRRAKAGRPGCR
jgi:hypothetical protein